MEEGVLTAPEDGDVGGILGLGFAPYTGGPLSLVDTVGIAKFIAECEALAQKYGERFAPPQAATRHGCEGRDILPRAEGGGLGTPLETPPDTAQAPAGGGCELSWNAKINSLAALPASKRVRFDFEVI